MRKLFVTLLDVFNNVLTYCTSTTNKSTTESVPALKSAIETSLVQKIQSIEDLIASQNSKVQGAASDKSIAKKNASLIAMTVINAGKSFAKATGNNLLLGKLKYSLSSINKIKSAEFAPVVNGLMTTISPFLSQLGAYGITQSNIDAVTAAVQLFVDNQNQPRQEEANKKAINEILDGMFSSTNDFMKTIIDPLVFSLSETNADYVTGYRAVRKHQPIGSHHTRLEATVTNELGQPYVMASVRVNEYTDPNTGKHYEAKESTTDINGVVTVSEFQEGIRSVTVHGGGTTEKTFENIQFNKGKATTETFICAPAFNNIPQSAPQQTPVNTTEDNA